MKILQINTVYKSGSTGKITKDINDLIMKYNYDSYIGYGRGEHDEDNVIKIGSKFDVYIHGLGTRLFDKHGLFSKKATLDFIEAMDKLNIDIFHLHNIHGYYLHYPLLFEYLKKKSKPVVWTLHDCWSFTGHCSYYEYVGCDKWQSECSSCPQTKQYPTSLFLDNSKENFLLKKESFLGLDDLTIITPSNWLKNQVQKSFLSKYEVKVINNGIDLDIFKPLTSNFREENDLINKFLILGVANVWEERKGLKYFFELAKQISSDEKIILIGLNKKQIDTLPSNIIGIGRTQNQIELAQIYSSVDVFVNPTLEDNFPTTNLESLACGVPIITFDSGGSKEGITKECGIIVEKENSTHLSEAIAEVEENTKKYYTVFCRERAEQYFNKNDRYMEYIKLYGKKGKIDVQK